MKPAPVAMILFVPHRVGWNAAARNARDVGRVNYTRICHGVVPAGVIYHCVSRNTAGLKSSNKALEVRGVFCFTESYRTTEHTE